MCSCLLYNAQSQGARGNGFRRKIVTITAKPQSFLYPSKATDTKAKVHLELNPARNIKDDKKHFFKYTSSKWKTRENVGPLLNEMGALAMESTEKAELLNAAFAPVFTAKADPHAPQSLEVGKKA